MRLKKRGPKVHLRKKECKNCLSRFKPKRSTQVFCSLECRQKGYKLNPGRPKVDLNKIEQLVKDFIIIGCNFSQASKLAGISYKTLNKYMNIDDDFRDKMYKYKNFLNLSARKIIYQRIMQGSTKDARWWLEHTDEQFMKTSKKHPEVIINRSSD